MFPQGTVRNAAEKACGATKRATPPLDPCHSGNYVPVTNLDGGKYHGRP